MGPGSLFTYFGPVPLTRCKREDQGETSTSCLPRHGTPGAKPEQRIGPNDAGHQRQRRETLVSAKALPRRSGPGELRSVSLVPGGRGKADCGTQAEPWSRRERPPASLWPLSGRSERDPPRRADHRGAPSSVPASAVKPSPEGKVLGGHSVGRATLPQGEAAQTRWKQSFGRGAQCAPLLLFFVKLD